ncbi:MAG TPA: acylphosphatase [Candidatus Eremiobacteraceae bacterium]|nr:acylphosphatase [Candidatus Eremiobacteraceae bacterium]
MPRLHLIIHGRVQGVFFRASVEEQARALRLTGWVRNRSDGSVETVVEGDADALAALRAYCRQGPPGAHVTRVDSLDEAETHAFSTFSIRA